MSEIVLLLWFVILVNVIVLMGVGYVLFLLKMYKKEGDE